jgi:hypothetical protein
MPVHEHRRKSADRLRVFSRSFAFAPLLLTKSLEWYNPDMQILTATRTKSGQFAPGSSGNPGERPKDEAHVAELARSYTSEAIDTLVELMRHGKDKRVRGTAAQALLDRGWGKPKLEVVNEGDSGYLEALQQANH